MHLGGFHGNRGHEPAGIGLRLQGNWSGRMRLVICGTAVPEYPRGHAGMGEWNYVSQSHLQSVWVQAPPELSPPEAADCNDCTQVCTRELCVARSTNVNLANRGKSKFPTSYLL